MGEVDHSPIRGFDKGYLIARVFCQGWPRPKGSLKPQVLRGKGGRLVVHLVESSVGSVPWKYKMIQAIREQARAGDFGYAGPVSVSASFRYKRPETGKSLALEYPILKEGPYAQADLDKLLRNLLDALTQSKLIIDDSQVVQIGDSEKRWTTEDEHQGVLFEVRAV